MPTARNNPDRTAPQDEGARFEDGTAPLPDAPARVRRIPLLPGRRSWLTRGAIWLFDGVVLAVVALAVALFVLSDRELTAPDWVTAQVGAKLDAGFPGADLRIERMSLRMERFGAPRLHFHGLSLTLPDRPDRALLRIPRAEIGLQGRALLLGQVQPDALRITGARLFIRRDVDGRFDLGFGEAPAQEQAISLPDLLRALDSAFAQPALAPIRTISATSISVELRDARAGRSWTVEDGRITLTQSAQELRIAAALTLPGVAPQGPGGTMRLPEAEVILTAGRRGGGVTLAGRLEAIPTADLAAQSRGLAWLAPLRAPVSGALRADLDAEGRIGPVSAKLEIGAGVLQPGTGAAPVPFEMARAYFTYVPETGRLAFDDVRLRSDSLTFAGTAQAYLEPDPEHPGRIAHVVAQMQAQNLFVDPVDLLMTSQRFDSAAADLRIGFAPFKVEIGQVTLLRAAEPDTGAGALRVLAAGRAELRPDGWHAAFDATVPAANEEDVAGLWPVALAPQSRAWVMDHVSRATVQEFRAAVRLVPGDPPRRQLTWRFVDTELQPLPGFPAITGASGFAALTGPDFTVTLEAGRAAAPGHGAVDLSGMSFRIPDGRQQPPMALLDLRAQGRVPDILALIDQPPLALLRGVPEGMVLAESGTASLRGRLSWPLQRRVALSDMDLAVTADLTSVEAPTLVPGHVLSAEALTLRADASLLTVSGAASLSGVPVNAIFALPLGAAARGGATVEGTVEISAEALAVFGIALPPGSLRGSGMADVFLELPGGGAPPRLRLASDLNRIALSIPALGWSKPETRTGSFVLQTELGPGGAPPTLLLDAPGLLAQGTVLLGQGGAFAGMDLQRVQAGGWLDSPIRLRAAGPGQAPQITLSGGRLALANMPSMGGGGGGAGSPIRVRDMRLELSDRMMLTELTGDIAGGPGGLSGGFSARVNGMAPIRGQLAPDANGRGTAIRVTGADAGAVLKAAGVFDRANDGELSLVLRPGGRGVFDGELNVANTRVTSASGLANLLNAVSIVGLLDQMSGPGILFSSIDAEFRLTPGALEVRQGSGVGPSLGISMSGIYDLGTDRLDMQGVISPVYLLNSIGQIFSRRGEGLFGFNYRMTGPARAPQVSVNPLSVLTPGMFRDLFRAPPPQLPAQ